MGGEIGFALFAAHCVPDAGSEAGLVSIVMDDKEWMEWTYRFLVM